MMFLTLYVPLLVAVVAGSTLLRMVPKEEDKQEVGSPDFKCFSEEGTYVCKELLEFLPNVDKRIKDYVAELKTSSSVVKALKKYNEDLESIKGSNCAKDKSNEDELNGAQENIEAIMDICVASAPQEKKDELNKVIKDALMKCQIADNIIRQNAKICASLRVAPSSACVEERTSALQTINRIMSNEGRAYFNHYLRNAFFIPKVYIDACLEEGTKDLKERLEASSKQMEKCMGDMKK